MKTMWMARSVFQKIVKHKTIIWLHSGWNYVQILLKVAELSVWNNLCIYFSTYRFLARPGHQQLEHSGSIQPHHHSQLWPVGRLWFCILKLRRDTFGLSPSYLSVHLCCTFCNFCLFPLCGPVSLPAKQDNPPVQVVFVFVGSIIAFAL